MKKRVLSVLSVLLIVVLTVSLFACRTTADWATQKKDTKTTETSIQTTNGSEKYIVYAALDSSGNLIEASAGTAASAYAVVGYNGTVAELAIPDEYDGKPITKVLACTPYSAYKCYQNGAAYEGEDARLQTNEIVTSIRFGANVTVIGAGVCLGMTNLEAVKFGRVQDEITVGSNAFAACPNLTQYGYSNVMSFGSYPQWQVADATITSALTTLAGTLPANGANQNWTSYKYYINNSNETDFMWYIDLEYQGERYRGVYFTSYRPDYIHHSGTSGYQDNNGYYINNIYWFKWEPISWTILEESNGEAFLVANVVLDSQEYYLSTDNRVIEGETVYPNNYKESTIRAWLNDSFYTSAFNGSEKNRIRLTTVDNSALSTTTSGNLAQASTDYVCSDTQDKIFLLSQYEVSTRISSGSKRYRVATDYAKAVGQYENKVNFGSIWMLRSPKNDDRTKTWSVFTSGATGNSDQVHLACQGVVPALRVSLS